MNGYGKAVSSVALIACALAGYAASARAQSAKDVRGAIALVPIDNEAAPKLIVDPPVPEQLALGRVFIQYRTENFRILPVFNKTALSVSPRVGHLHYYVDGQAFPTVDTSNETLVIVGLVTQERDATTLICRANYPVMRGLLEFLVAECCAEADCAATVQPAP